MRKEKETGLKASVYAALALAFASLGDAFLYPFLPLNHEMAGIPVVWVGLILSVNRFVRILSNTLVVHAFSRYGLRPIMVIAVVLAIASTLGYGLVAGILAWVSLRILWGLAFSALRLGALGYALQSRRRGLAFGVSRALQETGPMLSLLMVPLLLKLPDPVTIFSWLALFSLPALYVAWKLPVESERRLLVRGAGMLRWPSTMNSITFISAMVIDGIIVVVLGVLFLRYDDEISLVAAAGLAAFFLVYRRVCMVILSVAGGWIADRIGMAHIFSISLGFVILGLLTIICGWIGAGSVIVFAFYSIHSAITPGYAAGSSPGLYGIAENATWRDMGAAIGTLVAGFLIYSEHVIGILGIAALIMVSLLIAHSAGTRSSLKLYYPWK